MAGGKGVPAGAARFFLVPVRAMGSVPGKTVRARRGCMVHLSLLHRRQAREAEVERTGGRVDCDAEPPWALRALGEGGS